MLSRFLRFLAGVFRLSFVPARWRLLCFGALGMFAGLGLAVAHVSRAPSYLSDDPEACINCHVMTPQYASWQHSSHFNEAHCNDCHVPHDNYVEKMAFKARDGAYHSYVFTLRLEPQVIRLSESAKPVVEANCRRCHAGQLSGGHLSLQGEGSHRCWDCHREVPHGRVRSLSASPRVLTPRLPGVTEMGEQPKVGDRPPR